MRTLTKTEFAALLIKATSEYAKDTTALYKHDQATQKAIVSLAALQNSTLSPVFLQVRVWGVVSDAWDRYDVTVNYRRWIESCVKLKQLQFRNS